MSTQTVTLELPEALYHSAARVAQLTKRPLGEIVQESLLHALPPLDDVPADEALALAQFSRLGDAELWQAAAAMLAVEDQALLEELLTSQSAGALTPAEQPRLQELLDEYGRLLVRKAHAWLLLARRGYRVSPQAKTLAKKRAVPNHH
jgi:hypothetical protein